MKVIALSRVFVLFFLPMAVFASDLVPFSNWMQKRPNWGNDVAEISYASTRCGALLAVIGMTFETNPSSSDDVARGRALVQRGHSLAKFASLIASNSGMSKDSQLNRYGLLLESYVQITKTNRALHNNMFYGFIEGDLNFCVEFERGANATIRNLSR